MPTARLKQGTAAAAGSTLLFCAAAALIEGFDNQSMGVAAPRMFPELGLATTQQGLVLSATPLGLFLGAAIGGRAADYFGRRRTLIGSILLMGAFSLLTTLAGTASSVFIARFLTGLALGGAMPNFISLSSESVTSARRISTVALVMAGMPFGGALAALTALGAHWGWSWRSIFYVGGFTPILLGLIMLRGLPESAAFERSVASKEPQAAARVESPQSVLFGDSSRTGTTLLLWIAYFFTQLVLLLMLNWLPNLLIGLGLSRSEASWGSVCFNIAGGLGSIALGHLHAGTRRRLWVFLTYTGMAAALVTVTLAGRTFSWVALACALAGVFIVGAQLVLYALAPLYYAIAVRGTGVGAAVAIGRLGSVVGPTLAGIVLANGGDSTTVLLAIIPFVAIAGIAAILLTWRPQSND